MNRYLYLLLCTVLLTVGCKKETEETTKTEIEAPSLSFTTETYSKKTSLPCKDTLCTKVNISIEKAEDLPVVADSINKKVFNTIRQIVYFGEKPYDAKSYEELMASFIGSYEDLKKRFPQDEMVPWEADVKTKVDYRTDSIINIKVTHYTFTGGAHGYAGDRSLIFDAATGKALKAADFITDVPAFTALAEKKFREKYGIPANKNINATGLMFENEKFALPLNIFFTDKGLLLYYNAYEVASYAEQQKEVMLPYSEIDKYLKMK